MNTLLLLAAHFDGKPAIPLREALDICGIDDNDAVMLRKAKNHEYGFPCRRYGSQKSPYMVKLEDLARFIDRDKEIREAWEAAFSLAS